nr:retrovirus-related Pol polyprotein from transposon TNT 1-94 [Tanacetum cinerariifolium]
MFLSLTKRISRAGKLAHEGPYDIRDTKIAALRLKFNAFKALEEDEGTTKIKAFMAIAEEEPSVGKADARSDDTHVDLHYVEDQRKKHGKTAYDVFRGRSLDISYFHVFRCPMHIHNHKDHLGQFDEMDDDGFFLGYSSMAKAFRVFNIRRQEMEETYHVTFSEDDEAIS